VLLLVEDNPGDVELFCDSLSGGMLEAENVLVATSGTDALAQLDRAAHDQSAPSPDLVVLDLNLPGLDGRAVLSRLREDPRWRYTPVVILSSSDAEADVTSSYTNGANCYVAKPLGLAEYREAVRNIEQFWLEQAILPARPHEPSSADADDG
jgi:CheY-like chemotaxis protein